MNDTYEITTGANFFYSRNIDLASMYYNVELIDEIHADALQEAATLTLKRFPFFGTKLDVSDSGDRYILRANSKPFTIHEQPDFLPLSDAKANDYLITICFFGPKLHLIFSHGLTDAMGAIYFLKMLLHTYLCKIAGKKLQCPDIIDVYGISDPAEYCDPYEFLPELPKFHPFRFHEPFSFVQNQIDEAHIKKYSLCIPSETLFKKSMEAEGNISGLLSLILSRAIDAVHSDLSNPIVISCPFNLRRTLRCEKTLRNCNQSIKYVYSTQIKKYSFEQQLSMLKGMLYIQSMDEHQLPRYAMVRDMSRKANETGTIEEKKKLYSIDNRLATVPIISYVGNFEMGECTNFIKSISTRVNVLGRAGMLLMALCLNGECAITITSNLKTDDYYLSFLEQLKMLEIPYTEFEPAEL